MNKEQLSKYLNYALKTGADFVEIYYETTKNKVFRLNDSKLDSIESNNEIGLGIRIVKNEESFYTSITNLEENNIIRVIDNLLNNFSKGKAKKAKLNELEDYRKNPNISHDTYPISKKKELLYKIDKIARKQSKYVVQVSAGIVEADREFVIVNSNSKYVTANSIHTRIVVTIYTEKDGIKEHEFVNYGNSLGYEMLDQVELEKTIQKATNTAVEKLSAIDFKGGELPVVIAPGFGAVIFHEACGHGLEATSVANHLSVFSDDLNKTIATPKVTLIDDGTIEGAWGSSVIDDEGNPTQKNILIEKGILKEFLVDQVHSKKMQKKTNGCGRRQNFRYATTSRMSNTYLAPGTDSVDDMIKSIKLGVYCEKMSGGSVNPATGDFNFAVDTARLIKNGKLKEYLKGITLIGNSKDILKNVEMISDDLEISAGYCGSLSGMIPVTIGQPTIKVSKILVGGKE